MEYYKATIYKKGVVLLITLFFITAISVLILKNLKDNEELIDVVAINSTLTQINITIENVNSEIMKFFKKQHSDNNIDMLLDNIPEILPLRYGNVDLKIFLKEETFDGVYNLNDENLSQNIDELFNQNVDYKYDFLELFLPKYRKEFGKFTNQKQVNFFIEQYKKETKDEVIDNIKDNFTFIDYENNESVRYISCRYIVDVNGIKSNVDMVFKIGETKPLKLDVSFKR